MANEIAREARRREREREKKFEPSSLVLKGGGGGGETGPPLTACKYGNEALCKVGMNGD